MRWLIGHPGPQFSVHDVFEGWAEALRGLGEQVYTFNLDRRLQFFDAACIGEPADDDTGPDGPRVFKKAMGRDEAIETAAHEIIKPLYTSWPDVVLLVSCFFIPPYLLELIRARRHKLVLLHTESPYQDSEQLIRAAYADINLVNDPANLGAYRELGGRAEYMPHAWRETIHYPAEPGKPKEWDFAFVGTGFPSRVRFFNRLDLAGLNVRLAGPWLDLPEDSPLRDWAMTSAEGCVDNDDTAQIYRASRTGINVYRTESEPDHAGQGWACGPREIEMAATGLWFTRDPRPESDALFPMLPAFSTPEEAGEHIRWALKHPEAAENAAGFARHAIADRTFHNHAKQLLQLLDT